MTTLNLTTKEINLLKNYLLSLKAYKTAEIPLGAVVWTDTHEGLFDKVIACYHL